MTDRANPDIMAFRSPVGAEKAAGIWVDRIGAAAQRPSAMKPRLLGLHAAVYIEEGSGIFQAAPAHTEKIEAGDTLIIKPDIPASYSPLRKWKSKWVVWGGPEADSLSRMGFLSCGLIHDSGHAVSDAWQRLLDLKDREDPASFLERKAVLINMIARLSSPSTHLADGQQGYSRRISELTARIMQNPAYGFSVAEMAHSCGTSITNFRRIFRRHTGKSPKEFLLSARISLSKQLLAKGASIKEAAGTAGFDDVFYFMRAFRKVTGFTAGAFAIGSRQQI